jgi:amidophosphoribosyltransferase
MATSDGTRLTVFKDMGLVSNVFDQRSLAALPGELGIGHTRYSTTGSSHWQNAQPVFRSVGSIGFALAHNGNLTNTAELARELSVLPGMIGSDTDVLAELLAQHMSSGPVVGNGADALERACVAVIPRLEGAFSLVLSDANTVIAIRDRHGFRPMCLGRLDDGWVVASESPALDIVGATFERELRPGEMVVMNASGVRSIDLFPPERIDPRLCIFEFVYFARPDSVLYERSVHAARVRMGEQLALQAPVEADMVMGVPESGVAAAEGFARGSGIAYGQGLVKNRYIGRTFIAPTQELRALGVRMKLNPLREDIAGKRLVVVDDSIVRGTTTRAMVSMLRQAGAAEVHLRISSPPYRWPCYFGMDTGAADELLAARMTVDEIEDYLGVDSLAYLELPGLVAAIDAPNGGFCNACLTGNYPVEIPVEIGKHVLEAELVVGA